MSTLARPVIFAKDDIATVNRPDCEAHGITGVVTDADRVNPYFPSPIPQTVRVKILWPGFRIKRSYRYKAQDLIKG